MIPEEPERWRRRLEGSGEPRSQRFRVWVGAGAGQTTGQEAADVVDLGTRPHVVGEDDVVVTARFGESVGENRTGAAESEYRLIGVGGDDRGCGAGTDQFEQVRGLRVEVLGVVDDEVPDAAPLCGEQVRRWRTPTADPTSSAASTAGADAPVDRPTPPQQHRLLVLLVCPVRRPPTRDVCACAPTP